MKTYLSTCSVSRVGTTGQVSMTLARVLFRADSESDARASLERRLTAQGYALQKLETLSESDKSLKEVAAQAGFHLGLLKDLPDEMYVEQFAGHFIHGSADKLELL